jgi:hypothetical protein
VLLLKQYAGPGLVRSPVLEFQTCSARIVGKGSLTRMRGSRRYVRVQSDEGDGRHLGACNGA